MRPFTAVFGMGTGVTFSPWSPEKRSPAEAGRGERACFWVLEPRRVPPDPEVREVENGQASRRISIGRLSASPRLHPQPIEVVVCDLP